MAAEKKTFSTRPKAGQSRGRAEKKTFAMTDTIRQRLDTGVSAPKAKAPGKGNKETTNMTGSLPPSRGGGFATGEHGGSFFEKRAYEDRLARLKDQKSRLAGLDLAGEVEVDRQIAALNREYGVDLFNRVKNTASGAVKTYGATLGNAFTSLYDLGQGQRDQMSEDFYQDEKHRYDRAVHDLEVMEEENRRNPGAFGERELQSTRNAIEDAKRRMEAAGYVMDEEVQSKAVKAAYGAMDQLNLSGQEDIVRAKRYLYPGSAGQFAVDTGVALGQLGLDIGAAAVTGGSAMLPMAVRSYGGGAQQARQDRAGLGEQAVYGALSAALSTATEKLGNIGLPGKFFGGGALDDVMRAVVARFESRAGTAGGRVLLNRLGTALTSFASEGAEEALEAVVSPVLKRLVYSEDPIQWGDVLGDALYEFAVGGAVGGIMGGFGGSDTAPAHQRAEVRKAIARMLEGQGLEGDAVQRQATGVDMLVNGGALGSNLAKELGRSQAAQEVYRQMTGEELDVSGTPGEVRHRLKKLAAERRDEGSKPGWNEEERLGSEPEQRPDMRAEPEQGPAADGTQLDHSAPEETEAGGMDGTQLGEIAASVHQVNQVARMAQRSQVLGPVGKVAASARYDGRTDPDTYYAGFMQAYNAGRNNRRGPIPAALTRQQYNDAFKAGQLDGPGGNRAGGLVQNEYAGQLKDGGTIDALARKLGVYVVVEETISGPDGRQSAANGYIKDGVIHIALDAADPAMVVFKHEVTHLLQERGAKEYAAFRDYAVQTMGQAEVDRIQSLYREHNVELDREGAMDEVAANFTERLLTDEKAVRLLIRDDRTLAQKVFDAIRDMARKLTGQEGATLREAEKMWARMFEEVAGQSDLGHGTMGARYSFKGETVYGREGTEQAAEGGIRQDYTREAKEDRLTSSESRRNEYVLSRRRMSQGQRPVREWAEEGLIVPEPGSVSESEAHVVSDEYQLPVFVVKSDIFNQNHKTAPAFASNGQVFLREDLPEIGRGDIGAHEAGHAMKQLGYRPYLDFIDKTPDFMDRTSDEAQMFLAEAAQHAQIDLFNMSDADAVNLYDEINNMVYGAIHAGRTEVLNLARPAFYDFDAYSAELSSIHERFKKDRNKEARFSLRHAGGKTVVWLENSSLSNKDLNDHKAVAAFIAQHIGQVYTIIESGQRVYIGKELPGEYTQSKYTSYLRKTDRAAARAKNKAVDGLGELIETATNRRWEKTRHTQSKDAKYGIYRYDSTFAFPTKDASGAVQRVRAYDVELLIRNASDGKKYLYDIVSIKENTSAQIDLTKREAGSAAHQTATGGSVSATSVSQSGGNVNGRFSLKKYTDEEKKQHVKDAVSYFGRTYKWAETGYITTDGKRLDFSGRHEGGPGGYRTVDHRDIRDALGEDYGGDDYSGSMVQFMSEGNIRISPESGGINLSVMPTKTQLDTLSDFISKQRGEVMLDLDTPDGNTVSSTEYPRGTHANKVLGDIKAYFETGSTPYVSELAQFRFSLKKENERLRELNEYLREEVSDPTVVRTSRNAVKKLAGTMLRDYDSTMDRSELTGRLLSLYDYIANGRDPGGNELTWEEVNRQANDIAQDILQSAVAQGNPLYEEYAEVRSYAKRQAVVVPEGSRGDFEQFGGWGAFRKMNAGRMKLMNSGLPSDVFYQELSSQWPELFPDDIANPADQMIHTAEILNYLDAVYENPYSMELDVYRRYLADEILEAFYEVPERRTYAQRQQQKQTRQAIRYEKRLDSLQQKQRDRVADLRQQGRERVKQAVAAQRTRSQGQLEALKGKYQSKEKAARERREAAATRAKIERHVKKLSQLILRPSDKAHVPESLKKPVAALLASINLESQFTIDPETGKRVKGKAGDPVKRTQAFQELRAAYEKIAEGGDYLIDPDLQDNLKAVIALKDKRLFEMTQEELETVWRTVRAMEVSIQSANRLLSQSRYESVAELAEDIRRENSGRREKKNYVGPMGYVDGLLNLDMLTPETFFHRLGKGGEALFGMMRRADDTKTGILRQAVAHTKKLLEGLDARKLEKEMHTVHVGGRDIEMSTAQIMELYVLSRRKQARDHLYVGGMRTAGGRKGLVETGFVEPVHVTAEDVGRIVDLLTPEQRRAAEGMQTYLSEDMAEKGNEASMQVYGYQKFNEKFYWPIQVDRNQTRQDMSREGGERLIPQYGMTKQLNPDANNALVIGSIFDSYTKHVTEMATYAAWLATWEDVNRVRNARFYGPEGQYRGSVQEVVEKVFGKGGGDYITNLLRDAGQGTKKPGDTAFSVSRLTGAFKASAVGANFRVVLQQPTAALRALNLIDPKYFLEGMARKGDWEKVKKWAPIAQWKDWGYFEMDTGRALKDVLLGTDSLLEKTRQGSMWMAGKADSVTWARLWNACEAEVADKRPGLKHGSDEFYKAVAERFTQVIDQTQVVDSVLHRSQNMRSSSELTKMMMSFVSEPVKVYNMFYRALCDLRNSDQAADRAAGIKLLGRTGFALTVSFAANAIAQAFMDALRDDDREKKYWEKLWNAYQENFLANFNPLGYLPWVKDMVSLYQGYDVSRMDMESMERVLRAADRALKATNGEGKQTVKASFANLFFEMAGVLGVPVSNLKRDIMAVIQTAAIEMDNYLLQYRIDRLSLNLNYPANSARYMDILYQAMQNDREAYEIIYDDLVENGFDPDKIAKGMEARMKKAQGAQSVEELERRFLSPEQERRYETSIGQLERSSLWGRATGAQRRDVQDDLYQILAETDRGLGLEEKIAAGREYGVTRENYLLYELAKAMADEDGNGSTTQLEAEQAAAMVPGLSDAARGYLWQSTNKGWKEKNNPWK